MFVWVQGRDVPVVWIFLSQYLCGQSLSQSPTTDFEQVFTGRKGQAQHSKKNVEHRNWGTGGPEGHPEGKRTSSRRVTTI